ncbi:hypothetical protein B296_00051823 [Ensete ventricosum]|uniref:Uncharacterized protein n=1 Tax=Ensete ventricosum TaxID=4639 RepID=A0A426YF07_ENSVE|nr:hypothetical protein B296_00051823 [Ensete ventricosum]
MGTAHIGRYVPVCQRQLGEGRRGRTWISGASLLRRFRSVAYGEKKPRQGFVGRISLGDRGEKKTTFLLPNLAIAGRRKRCFFSLYGEKKRGREASAT